MPYKVLIVEDQPLIAMGLEEAVEELGHFPMGIAANLEDALALGEEADLAFVDVNLDDGPTGPEIGRQLAERGVAVLFMTSEPGALEPGVPGTMGVIAKPMFDLEMIQAIQYAVSRLSGEEVAPPERLVSFPD